MSTTCLVEFYILIILLITNYFFKLFNILYYAIEYFIIFSDQIEYILSTLF